MHDAISTLHAAPAASAFRDDAAGRHEPATPPKRAMLIVEDDPWTRRAIGRFFGRLGWDILSAETVAEGLALLGPTIDGAILDLNLPDGDGARVLEAIRAAGMSTRVVVASATVDEAHLARVARLAPDLMVHKPIEYDALVRAFDVPA